MRRHWVNRKGKLLTGLALGAVLAAGAVVGLDRQALLARYYVWQLARAPEGERDTWVRRTADLESAAVPRLLDCLGREDPRACANARVALGAMLSQAGEDDGRRADLLDRLASAFPGFSVQGQGECLELATVVIRPVQQTASHRAVWMAAGRLVEQGAHSQDSAIQRRSLALVEPLLAGRQDADTLSICRRVVQICLKGGQAQNEMQAIRLALRPEINCLDQVVPLLNDPTAEVRQTAMVALGDAPNVLGTDDLLQWLHDPDPDVRRLCEEALLWSRHLPRKHLKLGRLLTDPRPVVRLQVLDCLGDNPDLDPSIWLRRLSHDPSPAVRAAAARDAAAQGILALGDRLEQMAESDPSLTVRQLARHYLQQLRSVASAQAHSPGVR